MNEKKICFITCVKDLEVYQESLLYIKNLIVPDGYEIDSINIAEVDSVAKAYNAAMNLSDAKYKIYLHENIFIINKNFIKDILYIFESSTQIGLISMVGTKMLSSNLNFYDSDKIYGKVFTNKSGIMELTTFNEISNTYEEVQCIDGFLMATQYDIPWREDVFDGWGFYDISQSIEFKKVGYEVVVPNQEQPWVIHDCDLINVTNEYEDYRERFLEEYLQDIFPLVSILIPTYNCSEYFQIALKSALNQTYRNIEIIVGDDSTNNEIQELIRKSYLNKYSNIKYYHNENNLGQFDNNIKLLNMSQGEFINYLIDDDLFEVSKIEKMMNYFVQDKNEEISLITSHRAMIDENGNNRDIFGNTDNVFEKDTIVDGIELGNFILMNNNNCVGEPTTVLFRKNKLLEPFGTFNGRKYGCNVEQASWFNLLVKGKAVYINEVLSYCRFHHEQQQNDNIIQLKRCTDYLHEILTCQEKNYLQTKNQYFEAARNCLRICEDKILIPLNYRKMDTPQYLEFERFYNKLKDKYKKYSINLIENNLSGKTENEKQRVKNDFEFDYKNELFIRKNYNLIDYADGSEQYIIDVFERIENNHDSLQKYIKDWPSKYHLSKVRTNIFESIRELIYNKKNVLELGGGMGAVTQWLSENCNYVDVIEGSFNRAKANRLRNKVNLNVQIFIDDLLNMTFPKNKYDLATLIGVLEYIPYYSNEKSPEQACISFLSRVSEHLEDNGLLVIAIENKLGAKYFSGCVEDHNAQLFSGIHGYPNKSPITFSRVEIKNILNLAGYKNVQFYHCFPDYKMPKVILQESEKMYNLNVASIARGLFVDYANQREFLMCDPLLIDTLTKARLLHEISNSFLIVCSKTETVNLKTENLGIKFWNDETVNNCYHHKINFIEREDRIYVERKSLDYGKNKVDKDNVSFNLNNEIMIEGGILSIEAYRSLFKKDKYISLIELVKEVRRYINKEFSTNQLDDEGYQLLRGEAVDCCFNNIIRDVNEKLIFIDKKWKFKSSITEDYVIFRSLLGLFNEMYPYIQENSLSQFVIFIMSKIYPNYDRRRFEINLEIETLFQKDILNNPIQYKDFSVSLNNKAYQYKKN